MGLDMKDVTAETAKNTSGKKTSEQNRQARKSSDEYAALQRSYGEIGISAVAAAVRFFGDAKNMA